MSKPTDPAVIHSLDSESEKGDVPQKQSIVRKTVNFVKEHKKTTAAAVGLAALVAVSAFAGRQTAPGPDVFLLELESPEETDTEVHEATDTVA